MRPRSFVRYKQKCHPARPGLPWARSEEKWRDLQFNGPLMEMFSDQ